jgi:WD repeat-containing protein 19
VQLSSEEHWSQLGTAALEALDLPLAAGAFRQARDASMVLSLEGLRGTEDRHLLAAHVMVLLDRDHGAAQDLFLRSARPLAALEMRVDLKHWQQALALAQQLEPGSMAGICKEHAAMLEITGETRTALELLHRGASALEAVIDCSTLAPFKHQATAT